MRLFFSRKPTPSRESILMCREGHLLDNVTLKWYQGFVHPRFCVCCTCRIDRTVERYRCEACRLHPLCAMGRLRDTYNVCTECASSDSFKLVAPHKAPGKASTGLLQAGPTTIYRAPPTTVQVMTNAGQIFSVAVVLGKTRVYDVKKQIEEKGGPPRRQQCMIKDVDVLDDADVVLGGPLRVVAQEDGKAVPKPRKSKTSRSSALCISMTDMNTEN